jgi:predicted nucleic acid-binding protein
MSASSGRAGSVLDTSVALKLVLAEPLSDRAEAVLAQLLGVELWTADQHLVNALGSAAPWVRWIGDFPLPPAGSSA